VLVFKNRRWRRNWSGILIRSPTGELNTTPFAFVLIFLQAGYVRRHRGDKRFKNISFVERQAAI